MILVSKLLERFTLDQMFLQLRLTLPRQLRTVGADIRRLFTTKYPSIAEQHRTIAALFSTIL